MNNFRENVIRIWGDKGKDWLASLPRGVNILAQKWNLQELQPVPNLSYNYVLTGMRKHNPLPIILKLSFDMSDLKHEAAALDVFKGKGCVVLLDSDIKLGALLLEQAIPGTSLKSLFPHNDTAAMEHAIHVMKQLHAASLSDRDLTNFPAVSDWLQALYSTTNTRLSEYHLEKAKDLAQGLLRTAGPSILLHGDLHHDNILASTRDGWLAIDPKGVFGESIYELGAFIRNPVPELLEQPHVAHMIAHRLECFSAVLNIDKQRLKAWTYVQTVLAACWAAEENGDPSRWLLEADIIDKL